MKFVFLLCAFQVLIAQDLSEESISEEQEKYMGQSEMLEQTQYGCVILTKYQLQEQSQELLSVIKSYQQKQEQYNIYQKIQAQYVLQCLQKINTEQLIELFNQLRSQQFELGDFSDIFMMIDLSSFKDNDTIPTSEEASIIKYIDEFDKKIEEQKKKNKQDNDEGNDYDDIDNDDEGDPRRRNRAPQSFKLLGLDMNSFSSYSQLLILIGFAIFMGILLYFGLKMVQAGTKEPTKRQKKNKQK